MTRDEFIDMLMAQYEKNEQLKTLQAQRVAEEQDLAAEYKVDECNQKRAALAQKYIGLMDAVRNG